MTKDLSPGRMGGTPERPARFFTDAAEFGAWLAIHHDTETELWVGLAKKHVTDRGLTWAEAVPEALCWGWIDSVAQRIDDDFVRQRWTPRKRTSHWSKVNLELVDKLRADGRMQPAGLAIWEARRREAAPYTHEQEGPLELPADYAAQLAGSPAATAFFEAATPTYRRICVNWVITAKQQSSRDRRMTQLIEDSAAGRLIPSQRYGAVPRWVERAAAAARDAG
ncbi:MAG TPA: YdeI/OmpD-associated family protein [Flexivirga sp.]|uniref:YdeI/OmpD-associated family protein n=1 Tax=Flexivirga sp. TaxID=1962927 RepID=UPI002C304025|nr:YdeI/OmpD-associated family protein [Flexivirga sp.]HWC23732.1 YdeI/OmpD-associated family protein [Flexivirga sp.]